MSDYDSRADDVKDLERDDEPVLAADECNDWRPAGQEGPQGGCSGRVAYRMALSPSGKNWPRCDSHWAKRLKEEERLNRDYPDSPIAPAWFDPMDAGETW